MTWPIPLASNPTTMATIRDLSWTSLDRTFRFCTINEWDAPLTLSMVCRGWQAMLVSSRAFWTTINVSAESEVDFQYARLFAELSDPLCLSVVLHIPDGSDLETTFAFLFSVHQRIEALEIEIDANSWVFRTLDSFLRRFSPIFKIKRLKLPYPFKLS